MPTPTPMIAKMIPINDVLSIFSPIPLTNFSIVNIGVA